MELVLVSVYGCGYYSDNEYEESIWLTKETFDKIVDDIPSEISLGELDGKHSQVFGDVEWEDFSEKNILHKPNPFDLVADGTSLEEKIWDVLDKNGINYSEEKKKIYNYINSLDYLVRYERFVPKSQYENVNEAVKEALSRDYKNDISGIVKF
jgi:hypothetical protein